MRVRVKSPMFHRGRRVERGEVLEVEPLTASELCSTHRCELVDPRDAEGMRSALQADVKRVLRAAGQPWRHPEPSGGWQRVH